MGNELKDMLQSVLREALEPINQRLERLESDVSTMKANIATKEDVSLLPQILQAVFLLLLMAMFPLRNGVVCQRS